MFKKATRESVYLKMGVTGPSGSGKTTGALKLARGLVGEKGRIALIDTENGSASLYSDITAFDVCDLQPPFEDKKFSEAIKFAESEGYDAVIIDSASHFWEAVLDYKDKLDKRGGNSFTNWKEAGDRFKVVLGSVLQSQIHVILCLRSKMEHTMEKDDRGRTSIKKVGLAPIMRDGIEYEFTVVFDLDMSHNAASSKDRTRLFDGRFVQLTEEVGQQLNAWRKGDEAQALAVTPKEKPESVKEIQRRNDAIDKVVSSANEAIKSFDAATESETPETKCSIVTDEQVSKLKTYSSALNMDAATVAKAIKWAGSEYAKEFSQLSCDQAEKLIKELQRRMNEVPTNSNTEEIKEAGNKVATEEEAEEDVPFDFAKELSWLEPDSKKVNERLIEWGWIGKDQTWKNLPADKVKQIKEKTSQFCKAVNIEMPKEVAA